MITRRRLFSLFGYLGIASLLPKTAMSQTGNKKSSSQKERDSLPPHCEALLLVWSTQQALIREIETKYAKDEQTKVTEYGPAESRWWFDADSRNWKVERPFAPGVIDTTHWFYVTYLIENKTVGEWSVDTEKKEVLIQK